MFNFPYSHYTTARLVLKLKHNTPKRSKQFVFRKRLKPTELSHWTGLRETNLPPDYRINIGIFKCKFQRQFPGTDVLWATAIKSQKPVGFATSTRSKINATNREKRKGTPPEETSLLRAEGASSEDVRRKIVGPTNFHFRVVFASLLPVGRLRYNANSTFERGRAPGGVWLPHPQSVSHYRPTDWRGIRCDGEANGGKRNLNKYLRNYFGGHKLSRGKQRYVRHSSNQCVIKV